MAGDSKYKSAKSENLKDNLRLFDSSLNESKRLISEQLSKNVSKQRVGQRKQSGGFKISPRNRSAMPKGYKGYGI
jgi:hypothetical protein